MAFDIDKYTANSTAVGWDDLDFDEFDRNPLPASTLMVVSGFARPEFVVEIEAVAAGPAEGH